MGKHRFLGLIALLALTLLACRLSDAVTELQATAPPAPTPNVPATVSAALTGTAQAPAVTAGWEATSEALSAPQTEARPSTEEPLPTDISSQPEPTTEPLVAEAPTSRPEPPPTPEPTETEIPPTVAPQFPYQIVLSYCGPNVVTFIEGTVEKNGELQDGLLVRISQGPDGQPDPNDDDKTGSHGDRHGYYFHNIDSGRPHAGTWYLWVMDPKTMQRISAIAIVKTDGKRVEDSDTSAGSCQSATVNFAYNE